MQGRLKLGIGMILPVALFVYGNNTTWFASPRSGSPAVLAHRGMAQSYDLAAFRSCTAAEMSPPKHDYLENTIPAIEAAFDRGADVVEFDIRRTLDHRFAVFHDRTLDCKTDGRGLTRKHTLEQLKALDVGYGYTADGGRTYPFRGKGVGLMPSLEEIFEAFPGRSFLIDLKGSDPADGALLADRLSKLPLSERSRLMVYGTERALAPLRERLPEVGAFSTRSIQNCLVRYIVYGWTGFLPSACENSPVFVPINVAPWLWGWPNLFMERMEAKGSTVAVVGPFRGTGWSPGLDTPADLARLPVDYDGGIWTNEVERIVAAVKLN